MTVEHALPCKVSGLVQIRHGDVADEQRHLCGCALSFGHVERKPQMYYIMNSQVRMKPANNDVCDDLSTPDNNNTTQQQQHQLHQQQRRPQQQERQQQQHQLLHQRCPQQQDHQEQQQPAATTKLGDAGSRIF